MEANVFKIRIIRLLLIMMVSMLMFSCASIVNQPHKYMTIHTTEQSKIIFGQDTIHTIDNKAHLKVERKKETLSILAATDSLTKTVTIRPGSSIMYWSNICFNLGLGMLVDKNDPRRYSYPDKIYINVANATNRYSCCGNANNKGELYFHLMPSFSFFNISPESEGVRVPIGFGAGIGIGIDYYHSKKQFLHLGVSMNDGIAFKLFADYSEYYSNYIHLSNNHKIKRLSIGYGISFTNNTWKHWEYYFFNPKRHIKKNHKAFGFIFPLTYQFTNNFNIGFVYRPTFYRPNMTDKFVYESLTSFGCALKIRMKH